MLEESRLVKLFEGIHINCEEYQNIILAPELNTTRPISVAVHDKWRIYDRPRVISTIVIVIVASCGKDHVEIIYFERLWSRRIPFVRTRSAVLSPKHNNMAGQGCALSPFTTTSFKDRNRGECDKL